MAEYIDKEALVKSLDNMYNNMNAMSPQFYNGFMVARHHANEFPAADVVSVVRCKNCIYYHKAHVLCNDGTEKDFSEFPPEAFGSIGYGVTAKYGINVGGKCEIDTDCGYADDKSVFRQPNDFCSRGKRSVE